MSLMAARAGLKVYLIDRHFPEHKGPELGVLSASQKAWVSAIARPAQKVLRDLGVWDKLEKDACAYKEMQVEMYEGSVLNFSCMDVGEENLGHIVNNFHIKEALWNGCLHEKNIQMVCDEPEDWCIESGQLLTKKGQSIRAELLIGADGVNSWARKRAGIEIDEDVKINDQAWVGVLRHEKAHRDIARQKFFTGGVVGLLPMANPRESVMVWSQSKGDHNGREIDDMSKSVEAKLQQFFPDMGSFEIESDLIVHGIQSQGAKSHHNGNVVLVGDAATSVHPLAGQGLNLGLRSVGVLAETFKQAQRAHAGLADEYYLRRYSSKCEGFNALSRKFFVQCRLLDSAKMGYAFMGWGVSTVNHVGWLRRMFIAHALYADL